MKLLFLHCGHVTRCQKQKKRKVDFLELDCMGLKCTTKCHCVMLLPHGD